MGRPILSTPKSLSSTTQDRSVLVTPRSLTVTPLTSHASSRSLLRRSTDEPERSWRPPPSSSSLVTPPLSSSFPRSPSVSSPTLTTHLLGALQLEMRQTVAVGVIKSVEKTDGKGGKTTKAAEKATKKK